MNYSQYPQYELRRKFWKWFGAQISVLPVGSPEVIGFIKMKAFKLREDIRLYQDATMSTELMSIHARQIIDFGATYDVTDSQTQQPLFALKRKGFRSGLVRDTWEILDTAGKVIGSVRETSGTLALLRRWLGLISDVLELIFAFVPQTYEIKLGIDESAVVLATIVHTKNPIVVKMVVDQSMAPAGTDPRIALAGATLLAIIDASKNS
jgi:hypothetical protein